MLHFFPLTTFPCFCCFFHSFSSTLSHNILQVLTELKLSNWKINPYPNHLAAVKQDRVEDAQHGLVHLPALHAQIERLRAGVHGWSGRRYGQNESLPCSRSRSFFSCSFSPSLSLSLYLSLSLSLSLPQVQSNLNLKAPPEYPCLAPQKHARIALCSVGGRVQFLYKVVGWGYGKGREGLS